MHSPLLKTYWDTFLYPGIVQRGSLEAADLGQTISNFTTLLCYSRGNSNTPFHCANQMHNTVIIY